RQVLSVEDVGDSLVATTRDAALTEILQKGSVDIQVVPISAQEVRNQYLAKKQIELARAAGRPVEIRTIFPTEQNGAAPAAAGIVTKHFDDERQLWENEAKTASLDSTLSVTVTVMADFEMDIDWFTVQSMYLEVLAIEGLDVELGFKWEDKLDDKEFSLAEIPLGQFGFGIGPIDLGVGIQAKPVIGWEKVTGEFDSQFRLQQSFVGILGVSYVKGSGTTVTHQTSTGFDTQFDAHGLATARPYAGIKVEVVICGSDANTIYVMPDAYLWAQAEGSFHAWDNFAHTSGQLDASLEFGVEWRVGYALDLFGLWSGSDYYSGNIYDKTWTFGTGYVH
ncbi:MAG: hypothetical protein HGB10_08645, partial [Coriobacteriia bacterium]|nr:hypothetical protein [Coriobacteriia bacterium]